MKVPCPTCNKPVLWSPESKFRPFCNKRCQLLDLGDWAAENHTISQAMPKEMVLDEEMLDALESELLQHNKFFVEPE